MSKVQTYLMRNDKLYKIGKSIDVGRRLKTFKTSNPKIELMMTCDEGKVKERELHRMFKHRKNEGEWFALSSSDLEICKSMMGTNTKTKRSTIKGRNIKLSDKTFRRLRLLSIDEDKTISEVCEEILRNNLSK